MGSHSLSDNSDNDRYTRDKFAYPKTVAEGELDEAERVRRYCHYRLSCCCQRGFRVNYRMRGEIDPDGQLITRLHPMLGTNISRKMESVRAWSVVQRMCRGQFNEGGTNASHERTSIGTRRWMVNFFED